MGSTKRNEFETLLKKHQKWLEQIECTLVEQNDTKLTHEELSLDSKSNNYDEIFADVRSHEVEHKQLSEIARQFIEELQHGKLTITTLNLKV